jgi:hypothetical protein
LQLRSQAIFARLIGLLRGDLGQRPMHRAPSTVGGCNAEASRRPRHLPRSRSNADVDLQTLPLHQFERSMPRLWKLPVGFSF